MHSSARTVPFLFLTAAQPPLANALQVLGRRVRGCLWALSELPERSQALAALRLWGAVLDCPAFKEGGWQWGGCPIGREGLRSEQQEATVMTEGT